MKTLAVLSTLIALAAGASSADGASTLCVGRSPGCFTTVQAAVDAAHDGDTITIAPGTYAGGITIDVSIDIRGAGASGTIIRGGGPVVTIGIERATTEPTVSLSGLTITGGRNDSFPDHAVTQGGGVRIPQGSGLRGGGATVTIRDSVITENTVASREFLASGFCGPFDCSFASGGGVFNNGTLTLIDTEVSDNQAGDLASLTTNASGAGIAGSGVLNVIRTSVTDNRAVGAPPAGGGAFAGGIQAGGETTIEDSVISRNEAVVTAALSGDFELHNALAGGIAVEARSTIVRTRIAANMVTGSYTGGQAFAGSGGIDVGGSLLLVDSSVDHNVVRSSIPAASPDAAFGGGGGMAVYGEASVRDSRFIANSVAVSAPGGFVVAGGGGVSNFGRTTLLRTLVTSNDVTARGGAGAAHGGGIENVNLFGNPILTLVESVVTANRVDVSPGLAGEGGGVFTTVPLTLTRTVLAGNKPGECSGC